VVQGDIDAMLTVGGTGAEIEQEAQTAEAAAPSDQAGQSSSEQPSLAMAVEVQRFKPPEPLLLAELHAPKREALFG
jgi:hypothetical protein